MKKHFFFFAAVAAALVSCAPKEIAPEVIISREGSSNLIPITITANLDGTKAFIDDESVTWTWAEGDELAVFDGFAKRHFVLEKGYAGKAVGRFSGEVDASFTSLDAVFPYAAAGDDASSYSIPAEQNVTAQTVDPSAMIAVAKGEKVGEDFNFAFTSAVSLLRFSTPEGVNRVILHVADSKDAIAGDSRSVAINVPSTGGRFWAVVNPAVYHGIWVFARTGSADTMKSTAVEIDLSTPGKGRNLGSQASGNTVAVIETADDYLAFATAFKAGSYSTEIPVYVLSDLDFSGKTFATVDNGTKKFAGTWNGCSYSMKNITATNIPMFYTPSGILNDIIIDKSCSFTKTRAMAGHWGIIARTLEPGEMNRCEVNCDWTFDYVASDNYGYGGLVGRTTGTISDCKMNGNLIYTRTSDAKETAALYVGGVVGCLNEGGSSKMKGCEMYGDMTFNCPEESMCPTANTSNKFFSVGGVVGYSKGTVENCEMYGDLFYYDHPWNTFLGGVVGNQEGSSYVEGCVMRGNLTAEQKYSAATYERLFVGGVVGRAAGSSKVRKCTNVAGKIVSVGSKTNNLLGAGIVGSILGSASVTDCQNYMTINQSGYGSKQMYIGGVNGTITAGSISNVQNYGPVNVDQFSSVSDGTVRVGGVIGSCGVNLDGGTIKDGVSSIHNAAQIYTHADASSIGYSHANFGGVVGVMSGNATNLTNAGKVYINFGDNKDDTKLLKYVAAGGILGRLAAAKTVSGCVNKAEVQFRYWGTAANDNRVEYVGGIVGCIMSGQKSGGLAATVTSCTSSGKINDSINNASYIAGDYTKGKCVGGIVGAVMGKSATERASITNCTSNYSGEHASSAGYFGGIVGGADFVNITGCYSISNIKAKRVGGIAAMPRNATISGCHVENVKIYNFDQCGGIANASNDAATVIEDNFVKNVVFESQGTIAAANFGAVGRNPVAGTVIQHNGISGSYKNNSTTQVFSASYAPYTGTSTFTCESGKENYIITE